MILYDSAWIEFVAKMIMTVISKHYHEFYGGGVADFLHEKMFLCYNVSG